MKDLIIILLCCLCIPNKIYSSECGEYKCCGELQLESRHKYIWYKFGVSNFIDVYIAEGDTICDVLIHDGKDNYFSTTCQMVPILSWAFDVMDNMATKSSATVDNIYGPYYKLSILNNGSEKILASSTLFINYSNEDKRKIEELKAFMIKLWLASCAEEESV